MSRGIMLASCIAIALHAASCAQRYNYNIASFNCTKQTYIAELQSPTYNSEVPFILMPGQLKGDDVISIPFPREITMTWHAEGRADMSMTYSFDRTKQDAFNPHAGDTLLFLFCPGVERPALFSESHRKGRGVVLHDLGKNTAVNGLSIYSACEVCAGSPPTHAASRPLVRQAKLGEGGSK